MSIYLDEYNKREKCDEILNAFTLSYIVNGCFSMNKLYNE
jgi:hypothetical protein